MVIANVRAIPNFKILGINTRNVWQVLKLDNFIYLEKLAGNIKDLLENATVTVSLANSRKSLELLKNALKSLK